MLYQRATFSNLILSQNGLLFKEQFGFPQFSSKALETVVENVLRCLENTLTTGATFIDLSWAFNCISHELLTLKTIKLSWNNKFRIKIVIVLLE